jgi:hypothetical protein
VNTGADPPLTLACFSPYRGKPSRSQLPAYARAVGARRGGRHQAALGHPSMHTRLRGTAGGQAAVSRILHQSTAVYRIQSATLTLSYYPIP